MTPQEERPPYGPRLRIWQAAVFYGVVTAAAIGWSVARGDGLFAGSGLLAPPADRDLPWWLAGPAAGLGLVGLSLALERTWGAFRSLGHDLARLVAPFGWPRVGALALLSGLAEEALFRGPLQSAFGFVIASLVFALLHGGPGTRYLPWSTFALVAGLAFGTLAGAYESVWPSAIAHVLVNLINLRRMRALAPEEAA